MLAALIATRHSVPVVPVFFYTNQLVAATNTFVCITVCRRAFHICTSEPIQEQLGLSTPGLESVLAQLSRYYFCILNYLSSNANIISQPSDLYLSNQIAGVITSATILTGILLTLPVAPQNIRARTRLQTQLALALAMLHSLGTLSK